MHLQTRREIAFTAMCISQALRCSFPCSLKRFMFTRPNILFISTPHVSLLLIYFACCKHFLVALFPLYSKILHCSFAHQMLFCCQCILHYQVLSCIFCCTLCHVVSKRLIQIFILRTVNLPPVYFAFSCGFLY